MTIFGKYSPFGSVSPGRDIFPDPLAMNGSTTTGGRADSSGRWCTPLRTALADSPGRWCSPANNAQMFLADSPMGSCCQQATGQQGGWGRDNGNDITSQLEKRDWQRKNLSNSTFMKDTTSSPASLWGSSFSSQNSSNRSSFLGGSSNGSSQSSVSGGDHGGQDWSRSSRTYQQDRMHQMD